MCKLIHTIIANLVSCPECIVMCVYVYKYCLFLQLYKSVRLTEDEEDILKSLSCYVTEAILYSVLQMLRYSSNYFAFLLGIFVGLISSFFFSKILRKAIVRDKLRVL